MAELTTPPSDQPCLIVKGGATDGQVVVLEKGNPTVVGSGPLAHLRLLVPDMLGSHARVDWDDQGIVLNDNSGEGATFVNGESIVTVLLWDGDVMTFAKPGGKQLESPRILVRIPPGSVPLIEMPPSTEGGAPPPPPHGSRRGPWRGRGRPPTWPRRRAGGRPRRRGSPRSTGAWWGPRRVRRCSSSCWGSRRCAPAPRGRPRSPASCPSWRAKARRSRWPATASTPLPTATPSASGTRRPR